MEEVTTFKSGNLEATYDGDKLVIKHKHSWSDWKFEGQREAITDLGNAIALAIKVTDTYEQRKADAADQ